MNLKRLSPVVMSHVIAAVTFGLIILEVYKIYFYLLSIKAQHPNNMLNQFVFISLFRKFKYYRSDSLNTKEKRRAISYAQQTYSIDLR